MPFPVWTVQEMTYKHFIITNPMSLRSHVSSAHLQKPSGEREDREFIMMVASASALALEF